MKKNAMLKIAAILMVAVLLTTCAISSTFAKYTTSATGSDSARVAKFGIVVNSTVNNQIFADSYASDTDSFASNTVVADTSGTKVVAPGTTMDAVTTSVTGTAEVAVNVSVEAVLTLTGWTVDGNEYCPIIFTINGETYGTKDTAATNKSENIAALKVAVESAIEAASADYAANTIFTAAADDEVDSEVVTGVSVSWAWPYEVTNSGVVDTDIDAKDTALGKAAAAGNPANIALSLTTVVTQIN